MSEFNWTEEAERLWNDRVAFWNSKSKEMWDTGSRKEILPFFQKHVDQGVKICDLGCGDGYGSYKFSKAGYEVVGVDVSEDMIAKANKINEKSNAQFFRGDISNLDFEDDHFDGVVVINALEWTESPLAVLKEIKRLLKSGGKACIAILGPTASPRTNSYPRLYGEKVVCNTMMPWEFEKLVEENGWEKVDELGVYKRETDAIPKGSFSTSMKQAMSFMWVFMLVNRK